MKEGWMRGLLEQSYCCCHRRLGFASALVLTSSHRGPSPQWRGRSMVGLSFVRSLRTHDDRQPLNVEHRESIRHFGRLLKSGDTQSCRPHSDVTTFLSLSCSSSEVQDPLEVFSCVFPSYGEISQTGCAKLPFFIFESLLKSRFCSLLWKKKNRDSSEVDCLKTEKHEDVRNSNGEERNNCYLESMIMFAHPVIGYTHEKEYKYMYIYIG